MAAKTFQLQFCSWVKVLIIALILKKCLPTEADVILRTLTSLTSEDVRFAESRCMNDSSQASNELKIKWTKWNYPDNNITHCYLKCFLSRLGLINLNDRDLNWNKLYQFWQYFDKDFDSNCLQNSEINAKPDGTCFSYYKIWRLLWEKCKPLMRYIAINQYQNLSKPIGVTATEFCDSLTNKEDVASEIISDSQDTTPSFLTLCYNLECIFRHFHYFDAYGRIDQFEILRSLDEAHVLTPKNIAATKSCSHRANSVYNFGNCEMAFELKKCLEKNVAEFSYTYRVRNKITQYY